MILNELHIILHWKLKATLNVLILTAEFKCKEVRNSSGETTVRRPLGKPASNSPNQPNQWITVAPKFFTNTRK